MSVEQMLMTVNFMNMSVEHILLPVHLVNMSVEHIFTDSSLYEHIHKVLVTYHDLFRLYGGPCSSHHACSYIPA
jgi:hypothetical protein